MPDRPTSDPHTERAPSARTRARRLPDRACYDRATIDAILDAAFVCHVGYVIEGQPFVTPTAHWRDGDHVYWHGSAASRMLRTLAGGVPVCLTVSLLDGFVLARSGFHHSMNYRSAMLLGTATPVEGAAKARALDAFIDKLVPGRSAGVRPATAKELKATVVLSMPIAEASAKVRTGPPKDDEEDMGLAIWAGVVPARLAFGTPEPDTHVQPGVPVPENVARLIEE